MPLLVAVGRLAPQKGFDLLLRASAALHGRGLRHRLVVLGRGDEHDALQRLATELGIADAVELRGFVANPHEVMARADLFVLSSRTEGMPLSLLEALALRLPVEAGPTPDLGHVDAVGHDADPVAAHADGEQRR